MLNKISYITILVLLISLLTGCEKNENIKEYSMENHANKEDVSNIIETMPTLSLNNLIEIADGKTLSANDLTPENIEKIADKDFWTILKKLCKRNIGKCDYEIYATDQEDCALVVVHEGSFKNPYWLYKDGDVWHIEYAAVPDPYYVSNVDNVMFYEVSGLDMKLLIIQDISHMGNGNTYVFQIIGNRLKNIGYSEGSVCRNRTMQSNENQIEFFADEGRMQVDFQDIDNDGKEELLVYGRKLIYDTSSPENKELVDVKIERRAYKYDGNAFVEMQNFQYNVENILTHKNMKNYHLYGISADTNYQVIETVETDRTNLLYTLKWENGIPVTTKITTLEDQIYKLEISKKDSWFLEEGEMAIPYIITEQINGDNRVYQVFIWEDGNLREVFVDEYRNYSLIDEEAYLSGDLYNTYGCSIDGDVLKMRGARVVLDQEGNVIDVDSEMRKYHYTNGYFRPTEDGLY